MPKWTTLAPMLFQQAGLLATAAVVQGLKLGEENSCVLAGAGGTLGAAAYGSITGALGLLGNMFAGRAQDRLKELAYELNDPSDVLRNRYLLRLVTQAIKLGLRRAIESTPSRTSTVEVLERLEECAPGHFERTLDPAAKLGLAEQQLCRFFEGDLEDFSSLEVPSVEQWSVFLAEAASQGGLQGPFLARAIEIAAPVLHDEFPRLLLNYAKLAAEQDRPAFAALELMLFRSLTKTLAEHGAKLDEVAMQGGLTAEAVFELERGLAQLRFDLVTARENFERRIVERLEGNAEVLVRLERFAETVPGALRSVDARLASIESQLQSLNKAVIKPLGQLMERPWEPARRRDLPFHFTRSLTKLYGHVATKVLPGQVDEFLQSAGRFRWWLWTGLEGAGKSRLAMWACQRAMERGWDAGFVSITNIQLQSTNWDAVTIAQDTLVVFDYVGFDAPAVRIALDQLSRKLVRAGGGASRGPRLRVLMLERHPGAISPTSTADLLPQWFLDLFNSSDSHSGVPTFVDDQFPQRSAPSFHISEMSRDEAYQFAVDCAAAEPGECDPQAVARRTLELLWPEDRPAQGRPLHIQLTARVLASQSAKGLLSFEDVIRRYLEDRVRMRRRQLIKAEFDKHEADQILNLMCVATLLRRVRLSATPTCAELPSVETLRRARVFLQLFGQSPMDVDLHGLEPDLIGEWFVKMWCEEHSRLDGQLTTASLGRVLDQLPGSTIGVGDFVQRTYRYFRDTDLWRELRTRLGRYSTPFGKLFDAGGNQAKLLGGTTAGAEAYYNEAVHAAIVRAIQATGLAIVVDLMAGGSARPQELLSTYGRKIRLLAIDRDDARLLGLQKQHEGKLRVLRREIQGRIGLSRELHAAFKSMTCDVVIGKKALHELPWQAQRELIADIGEAISPKRGRVVLYTDSPEEMDEDGELKWDRVCAMLPEQHVGAEGMDGYAEVLTTLGGVPFRPEVLSDAAVFANMWIKLKDWANYNTHEYVNRYFSSHNQLCREFAQCGLREVEDRPVGRFLMALQPTRFVEEAINRLGYLCTDSNISLEEMQAIFSDNRRYEVFWSVVSSHVWCDGRPTRFGAAAHVNARWPKAFDLDEFVRGDGGLPSVGRLGSIDFPALKSPSFEMPIHVYVLERRTAPVEV